MTVTGQGHDPQHIWDPLSRQQLEILGCNGAPTGNDFLGIKWSRDAMADDVT